MLYSLNSLSAQCYTIPCTVYYADIYIHSNGHIHINAIYIYMSMYICYSCDHKEDKARKLTKETFRKLNNIFVSLSITVETLSSLKRFEVLKY